MQFEEQHSRYGLKEVKEAADAVRRRLSSTPRTAVLAGTGLGDMVDACDIQTSIAYDQIPHFPTSTVQSHAGRLVVGSMGGQPVVILQGRFHLYEGYGPRAVTFPIRVLQALGIRTLVITNASGGLNPAFVVGDIMIINDHINLTGANPLVGPNETTWGPRFPDMTAAYDASLRAWAWDAAKGMGAGLRRGIYAGLKGPSLETPAEMRFLRTIGADAVGFSTVMESLAAVHGGMRVLGLSTITNMCLPDAPTPASVDAIIGVAQVAAPRLAAIVAGVLNRLSDVDAVVSP
jgi:purine-nucleoside phosphorylase